MHTQYFILTHTHILSHTAKLSPSLPPCRLISPFSPFRIWQQNGEKYTRIFPNGATPRIPLCKTDESLGPGRIVICRRRKWWAVVKNEFCNKLLSALTDTEYHLKGWHHGVPTRQTLLPTLLYHLLTHCISHVSEYFIKQQHFISVVILLFTLQYFIPIVMMNNFIATARKVFQCWLLNSMLIQFLIQCWLLNWILQRIVPAVQNEKKEKKERNSWTQLSEWKHSLSFCISRM